MKTNSLLHLDTKFDIKAAKGDRVVEGYGAVFGNKDRVNDIIMVGAFKESLGAIHPKMLKQHDMYCVIGTWDEVREDAKGLYVKGTLANTTHGNDMYELVKMGAIDSLSIGYRVTDAEYEDDLRIIRKADLFEVSFVTFPANEQARITNVKGETPKTLREFEMLLREAGYGREDATTIALRGFKAWECQREAGSDAGLGGLVEAIKHSTNILKRES